MLTQGEYAPSPRVWVREEVEHYERTGHGLRGRPVVVLTTRGARTGLVRKTPLMRVAHGGCWSAVASCGGAPTPPAWYANLVADPRALLQDGLLRRPVTARELTGPERAAWWSRACTAFPSYAGYASRAGRRIPVLLLEPDPDRRGRPASGTGPVVVVDVDAEDPR